MDYDLVGIGNALVDIQVITDDAFIESLGVAKGGMTLSSRQEQIRVLEKLSDHPKKLSSGGSAANTIHGVGVLGGKTYYLGRVANDSYGKHYTEDMQSCGVGFPGSASENENTGTSVILITPDTQRTMLTHLGISASLHADNIDETIVRASKMVYIEGYLWTGVESRAAAQKMADLAKKERIPVAFTLSDSFVADGFKESLVDFIRRNVDILFCNEIEATTLTNQSDVIMAFKKLQVMADTLFVTLGAKGSLVGTIEGQYARVKTFPVKALDTTGAGDLFAAGAIYGLLNKFSLKECAIVGSYCASQVVTHLGARMPVHAHTDVSKILQSYQELI